MNQFYLLFLYLFVFITAQGQHNDKFNLTGRVVSVTSNSNLPFVDIINKHNYHGTISDENGHFNIVAVLGDTIIFSSIGYQTLFYPIDPNITEVRIEMITNNILLPEHTVLPIPKSILTLRQSMFGLNLVDSSAIFKSNMIKAGIKPPPIHPIVTKATIFNPISFFYEKIIEPFQKKKIKKDKVEFRPKLE